ncbi:MAG: GTPase Obg [Candidatus Peribacteria bacterium]|nr:GTPase Obg [Candidatus Peribacteria bacterium]
MFLDEAIIEVSGGQGGNGCVSWRREKFVPKGGPDGGDGGRGGSVIIRADANTDTLSTFASSKRFEAYHGKFGSGSNRHGYDGEDRILLVPPGTIVTRMLKDGSTEYIADLVHDGDELAAARGGRGGYGNAHFKSSTRQSPDFAEYGEPGEKTNIKLELKLVADVGIIGYPSVGKSTLISVISSAKPKIADYPFTTLVPNLGVVHVDDRSYIVADVPGLIEGASEGKGLGDTFLKHIERCGALLHVLDASRSFDVTAIDSVPNPELLLRDYKAIRKELEAYSPSLAAKRELIILNKADLIPDHLKDVAKFLKKHKLELFMTISAGTAQGTTELKKKLLPIVLAERESRVEVADKKKVTDARELRVLRPHLESESMGSFRLELKNDAVMITGKRLEQFTVMTNFSNAAAQKRFYDVVERIGLLKAIKKMRTSEEQPVFIGAMRVDPYLE